MTRAIFSYNELLNGLHASYRMTDKARKGYRNTDITDIAEYYEGGKKLYAFIGSDYIDDKDGMTFEELQAELEQYVGFELPDEYYDGHDEDNYYYEFY